jgi:hypothetical protein
VISRGTSFNGVPSHDAKESIGKGRSLIDPQSQWRHDTGEANPDLHQAIAKGDISSFLNLLPSARLLIPLAESEISLGEPQKSSDLAIVCMTAKDGRLGLLAFTSVDALKDWNAQARPIPIEGRDAAIAALDEGASAILIDIASSHPLTITLPDLVQVTGIDQRYRVVPLLGQLTAEFGITDPRIEIPETGPVHLVVPATSVSEISAVLRQRGDIHAFAPEGIAVTTAE